MAYLACVSSSAVNGVAAIHSEIVKQDIFNVGGGAGREVFLARGALARGSSRCLGRRQTRNASALTARCCRGGRATCGPRRLRHPQNKPRKPPATPPGLLQAVPREVPEQDQRRDAAPMAGVLQPRAGRAHHQEAGARARARTAVADRVSSVLATRARPVAPSSLCPASPVFGRRLFQPHNRPCRAPESLAPEPPLRPFALLSPPVPAPNRAATSGSRTPTSSRASRPLRTTRSCRRSRGDLGDQLWEGGIKFWRGR